MYLKMDADLDYLNNSQNSTVKKIKQFSYKMDKQHEETFYQRRYMRTGIGVHTYQPSEK